jgi:hypothetical protein
VLAGPTANYTVQLAPPFAAALQCRVLLDSMHLQAQEDRQMSSAVPCACGYVTRNAVHMLSCSDLLLLRAVVDAVAAAARQR